MMCLGVAGLVVLAIIISGSVMIPTGYKKMHEHDGASTLFPELDFTYEPTSCIVTGFTYTSTEMTACDDGSTDINHCYPTHTQCTDSYSTEFTYPVVTGFKILTERDYNSDRTEWGACLDVAVTSMPPFQVSLNPIDCWEPTPGRDINRDAYFCDNDECIKLFDPASEYALYLLGQFVGAILIFILGFVIIGVGFCCCLCICGAGGCGMLAIA